MAQFLFTRAKSQGQRQVLSMFQVDDQTDLTASGFKGFVTQVVSLREQSVADSGKMNGPSTDSGRSCDTNRLSDRILTGQF